MTWAGGFLTRHYLPVAKHRQAVPEEKGQLIAGCEGQGTGAVCLVWSPMEGQSGNWRSFRVIKCIFLSKKKGEGNVLTCCLWLRAERKRVYFLTFAKRN